MSKLESKIENARRLAELSRRDSERHAAAGRALLARHHADQAAKWTALADDLEENR